jgi:hypothetical protein
MYNINIETDKFYLLFTDDPNDPHLEHVPVSKYIQYHNADSMYELGGEKFIIFTDRDLAVSVLNKFRNREVKE